MEKSRLEIFEDTTRNSPTDSFAHYALAMEYEKAGRIEDALATYRRLIGFDPAYVPAFQMCGQLLVSLGRSPEAREILTRGLEAAQKIGNAKAANEIQVLLSGLAG
ncbi:MAG: tetratricopeptide repeat protein [Acidobacteriia bacterium]|nr:tetratricopeptide repeat protein [Terriglobia bacterium]